MSATNDYLESLYKEMYRAELDRSDKLDSQINLPTVIVTIFLGASAFYFERLPKLEYTMGTVLFYISMLIYLFCVIATIFCMVRSYTKYEYALLPVPNATAQRFAQLRDHYQKYYEEKYGEYFAKNQAAVDDDVKKNLQESIIDFYQRAATENRTNNIKRGRWVFYTTVWIVASLIALLASRIVFYAIDVPRPQKLSIGLIQQESGAIVAEVVKPPNAQKVVVEDAPIIPQFEMTEQPRFSKSGSRVNSQLSE